MRCPIVSALAAALLAGCGGGSERPSQAPAPTPADPAPLPAAGAPLPREPAALADRLTETSGRLADAIDAWVRDGDPGAGAPPRDVALLALHRQRIVLRLVRARALYERVVRRLAPSVRADLRADVLAKRELAAIHSVVVQRPRIKIGHAQPAGRLLGHYRRAQRRFDVGWPLLAAVNFVESAFGRLRNESVSGARGPMQFMPATWRAYGLGGRVRAPRDAILGAANYLHASGAPGDERRALYAYNPSRLYVSAVSRFARRIRRDSDAYYEYYAWQVFVRSRDGYRRVSSFGL